MTRHSLMIICCYLYALFGTATLLFSWVCNRGRLCELIRILSCVPEEERSASEFLLNYVRLCHRNIAWVRGTDRELLSDDKEQQSYIAYKDKLPWGLSLPSQFGQFENTLRECSVAIINCITSRKANIYRALSRFHSIHITSTWYARRRDCCLINSHNQTLID